MSPVLVVNESTLTAAAEMLLILRRLPPELWTDAVILALGYCNERSEELAAMFRKQ